MPGAEKHYVIMQTCPTAGNIGSSRLPVNGRHTACILRNGFPGLNILFHDTYYIQISLLYSNQQNTYRSDVFNGGNWGCTVSAFLGNFL